MCAPFSPDIVQAVAALLILHDGRMKHDLSVPLSVNLATLQGHKSIRQLRNIEGAYLIELDPVSFKLTMVR